MKPAFQFEDKVKTFATVLCAALIGVTLATAASTPENPAPNPPAIQFEPPASAKTEKTPPLPRRSRGEILYETHCGACHASRVHLRSDRRATSVAAVEGWVRRWSGELKLRWDEEAIAEVTLYLVRRYYKFELTPVAK